MSYAIAIVRDFYGPKQTIGFYSDERQYRVVFDTVKDAQEAIYKIRAEIYVLAHNESNSPTYYIIDENTAEYIATGRNSDMSNYDWDGCDCDCGECDECLEFMLEQDIQLVKNESKNYKNNN